MTGLTKKPATRKFEFIKHLNSDPMVTPAAFKVACAYLDYTNGFGKAVYRSMVDLQVDTGHSDRGIAKARKLLAELGYLEPSGRTSDGVLIFRLLFVRELDIADHRRAAREKLLEMQTDKKNAWRKRHPVPELSSGTEASQNRTQFGDRTELSSGKSVEYSVEASIEERGARELDIEPYIWQLQSEGRLDEARELLDTFAAAVGTDGAALTTSSNPAVRVQVLNTGGIGIEKPENQQNAYREAFRAQQKEFRPVHASRRAGGGVLP